MSFIQLIGLSIALAMDAFAVAIATGVILHSISFRQFFRLAYHFGFFQAMMPVLGWFTGISMYHIVEQYDHWVVFGLLSFIGGKMIKESFQSDTLAAPIKDPTKGFSLVILSIATSIDALAVGFSLSLLNHSIAFPALIIGCTASLFTVGGLYIGNKVRTSKRIASLSEMAGGIILIGIGIKILYSHIYT